MIKCRTPHQLDRVIHEEGVDLPEIPDQEEVEAAYAAHRKEIRANYHPDHMST